MSLPASRSGSGRQPGSPSSPVLVCSTAAPIAVDDARDPLGDVAVADQPDGAAADIADRLAQLRIGRPAAAFAGRAVQRRQATQGGQHQQDRSLGHRRRVGAGHIGHGDTALGGGVDVDGVDPGAELVHQPQPRRPRQVGAGQRPQHMPNHVGVG